MNLLASVLRTVVPLAVGWLLTVTGALGIDADSTAVAGGVTAAVTAVYYLLLRLVEEYAAKLDHPWLKTLAGLALGYARPPEYKAPAGSTGTRVSQI